MPVPLINRYDSRTALSQIDPDSDLASYIRDNMICGYEIKKRLTRHMPGSQADQESAAFEIVLALLTVFILCDRYDKGGALEENIGDAHRVTNPFGNRPPDSPELQSWVVHRPPPRVALGAVLGKYIFTYSKPKDMSKKTSSKILAKLAPFALCAFLTGLPGALRGQPAGTAVLHIKAGEVAAHVSNTLYGLMTEEINYSYDGGLYAELVRNRSFKEDPKEPVHWQLVQEQGGTGAIALDPSQPFNDAIATSLKLTVTQATGNQRVGIANEGFWGIPVRPNTRYRASFYAKAAPGFSGPLTVAIAAIAGATVHASARVPRVTGTWQKYEVVLTTGKAAPSLENRLVISAGGPGTVWFGQVSLFPPAWNSRPNGNRKDIMQLLADMKPSFLRFPGGNYLEGNTVATRFDWKRSVGDISQRPGHMDDAWRYWSSDGMGLLEFLEFCDDLHMQP